MALKQYFKAIYFPDHKKVNPKSRGLILAFGKKNEDLYQKLAPLSSQEMRELLGKDSLVELINESEKEALPVNTYCIWRLRKTLNAANLKNTEKNSKDIDPKYTTFRGGKKNPLHNWYSFIEGYSPEYVEYILDNLASTANVVYDPFAGTGVTPIVAAKRGLNAFYSEINPLLQFLAKTKIDISTVSEKKRSEIINNLEGIKENLKSLIKNSSPDNNLLSNYSIVFGKSKFFDSKTFNLILRVRTLVDEISYSNQSASNILLVAILNSLIPASLLQRAGDLRYKTREELKRKADFIKQTQKNLAGIISDIKNLEPLPLTPTLITENAKLIEGLPELKIDVIITSPPYLNGTNYFRNTKVELWFLRSIKSKEDLTNFRHASVTAGINDVSSKRPTEFLTEKVERISNLLKKDAYDQRIPKMVVDYFQDMARIFTALKKHLVKNSIIAIDIGDSIYGGVKVPTNELLIDVLEKLGYRFKESKTLRKRISRNGEILKQVLLIFEYPKLKKMRKIEKVRPAWNQRWKNFKSQLPHRLQPYSKRNWGHPLHSLCSYQGKMKPSLAHFLVKTFTKKGDRLLDPFVGVGTIPFEAALNGVHSFGFEISPTALVISKAKLGETTKDECFAMVNKLEKYIGTKDINNKELEASKLFGFNKKLIDYYHPKTLQEIVKAREFFKDNVPKTPSESLVMASLLHILHGNRPYALSRRSHGITPFAPSGKFEYKSLIKSLSEKVNRSLSIQLPENFVNGEIIYQDATSWWPSYIKSLDAVITSPPFFDSTRFYLTNWIRLWFSGWGPEDFKKQPLGFVDEKQKNSFAVYESVLRQTRERLNPGGIVVFHLGQSRKCNMANELSEIAKKWFRVVDLFEESVEKGESHGIRDKGTVVKHQYLVLT